MNQAEVSKLVSKLRIKVPPKHRKLQNAKGPEGRLDKLRKTVTGLIKFERIELNHNRADEARQYTERLIAEAIRHGDCHKPTMETADFWLLEKQLVHKLFKVLVPRYEYSNLSYTKMYNAPKPTYARVLDKVVLELRGNPYPDIEKNQHISKYHIQNVLLHAAKSEYRQSKIAAIADSMNPSEKLKNEEKQENNEPNIS